MVNGSLSLHCQKLLIRSAYRNKGFIGGSLRIEPGFSMVTSLNLSGGSDSLLTLLCHGLPWRRYGLEGKRLVSMLQHWP